MSMIQIEGQNDSEKTQSLKAGLESIGHSSANYEWHNGEPLYWGNPTNGFFDRIGLYCREVNR